MAKLNDPYIKAIRWASDRIAADQGIVAFISNNSFLEEIALDGVRHHLARDFDSIYVLDLGGNVWKNTKLSGTTHNVFGIKLGVSINFLVRKGIERKNSSIYYSRFDEYWRREQKLDALEKYQAVTDVAWERVTPDKKNSWLTRGFRAEFDSLVAIASREAKADDNSEPHVLFKNYSLGVATNRDDWMYANAEADLAVRVRKFIANYNFELLRYQSEKRLNSTRGDLDAFVNNNPSFLKWTDRLKAALSQGRKLEFATAQMRAANYRPFCRRRLYFDDLLNQRRYQQHLLFPVRQAGENRALAATGVGAQQSFATFATDVLPDLNFFGSGTVPQWFPFYTYSEDGTDRRENMTDWALTAFRTQYDSSAITKWDIFYYVYSALHHIEYRERYVANLRRELPRIPFVSGASGNDAEIFQSFSKIGKSLAEIHAHYEEQPEYPLKKIEKPGEKLDYRVEKMRLTKDKASLVYNKFLTLSGIPREVYEYRLGNRSALE